MIKLENVKKYYNKNKANEVIAIDNTSLELPSKGLVSILGNSGCGKTTLLNMIGGLDKPNSGKIFIDGERVNSSSSSKTDEIRNREIGYIFQNYYLVDDMTVFENVKLPLRMLGLKDKDEIKTLVSYALDMVGLYRYKNRPASALSGGERQRVGIARAIVKNPKIIIADEPTGNLDSGNSIEVMNIIKAISKEKLVILVTHERKLAEFYSDRIIEIVDGKLVSDKDNSHDNALDYRVENKIYLKDIKDECNIDNDKLNLSFYSDEDEKTNFVVVVKNGNLYIKCDNKKVEVVDSDSPIEFVDDHYHLLSKEETVSKKFDYDKLYKTNKKIKYHSIYNLFSLITSGMKKVFAYPLLKKILLIGFVASSMFVMYAVSNIIGINTITNDRFARYDKDYLSIKAHNNVENYLEAKNLDSVKYVLIGDSLTNVMIEFKDCYYQTNDAVAYFQVSLSALSNIAKEKIVYGKYPASDREVVLDVLTLKDQLKDGVGFMAGFTKAEDYIGREIKVNDKSFVISGICDEAFPCLYVNDELLFKTSLGAYSEFMPYEKEAGDYYNFTLRAIDEISENYKVVKGRAPEDDYEIILPVFWEYEYKLGSEIEIDGEMKKCKIVGFYESDSINTILSNYETYVFYLLPKTNDLTICPKEGRKDEVISYYQAKDTKVIDLYQLSYDSYYADIEDSIKTTTIIGLIVLGISLIEIFLMLRSSYLSRIKEVGTLRAIGLKKFDVYKMFLGEILSITTLTAPIGFIIMGYIVSGLSTIEFFANKYAFNFTVVIISVLIVYGFNILFGLIPVFDSLRKTPAEILSRTDVD